MTAKRAIKTAYVGLGLSAVALLGVKEPAFLGILVAGVIAFLLLIVFSVWMMED